MMPMLEKPNMLRTNKRRKKVKGEFSEGRGQRREL